MAIKLSRHDINLALAKVQVGLNKYLWLQGQVATSPKTFHSDPLFQRKYNGFYRVQRRSAHWMSAHYSLMALAAAQGLAFKDILDALYRSTARVEASFASKLFATLNPSAPVIDAWVLVNTGLRLPYAGAKNRLLDICRVHSDLGLLIAAYLATADGEYLVSEFTRLYGACVTPEKMLDLVLWQTRPSKGEKMSNSSKHSSGAVVTTGFAIP